MSTTVDNRVVQMRFDNEEFEKKASKSLSTLDKLKNALKFSGASKNLDDVNKSFKEVDANPLLKAIEGINGGFTTMVAKATLVNRATNALIDTTKRFVSSMTLDQVNAGWDKYAEKTSAVQTIMAATSKDFKDTGTQMKYVNNQLEKLNWFTDETSYNFTDMVGNIGKFTSNGIKLDRSVTSMQGIALWAARSGANANEASRAMYNLSQALSTGSVKLIDWKSIENANMATAEFKENVLEAAANLGKLKKAGDGTYKTMKGNAVSVTNFNNALSDAWFTSDVLMNVLDRYGAFTNKLYEVSEATDLTATQLLTAIDKYAEGTLDLQAYADTTGVDIETLRGYMEDLSSSTYELGRKSFQAGQEAKTFAEAISATSDAVSTGWMKTFELIFGDYQEAKKLWTNLANILYEVFAASGDLRNELLSGWREGNGRKTFLEGINATMEAILRLIMPIKEAFREIFPQKTVDDLLNITSGFKNLMTSLQLNAKQMANIKRIARGVFSAFDILLSVFKGLGEAVKNLIAPQFATFGDLLLEILGTIGDLIYIFRNFIRSGDKVSAAFNKIGEIALNLFEIIKKLFQQFENSEFGRVSLRIIQNVFEGAADAAGELLSYVKEVVSKIASLDKITFANLIGIFKGIGSDATNWFKNLSFNITDSDGVLDKFQNTVKAACAQTGASFINLSNNVTKAFTVIRGWLDKVPWGSLISIVFGMVLINQINKVINAIAALGGPIGTLTTNLNKLFASITGMFNAIKNSINIPTYAKIAKAIAVLALSIALLAALPSKKVADAAIALSMVIATFGIFIFALGSFPKIAKEAMNAVIEITACIAALAVSMIALAKAFAILENVDPNSLMDSTLAIIVLVGTLAIAANLMSHNLTRLTDASGKIRSTNTAAKNLLALSASIILIAKAFESFADIKIKDVGSFLLGVSSAVGTLIALTLMLGNIKGFEGIKNSVSLIIAIGAVSAMLGVIDKLGKFDLGRIDKIIKNAAAVFVGLAALFLTTKLIGRNAAKAGAMLAGIGAGIFTIIGSIKLLGSIKEETLRKGLRAIRSLSIVIVGLMAASALIGENAHKISITLLAAAGAIGVLAIIGGIVGALDNGAMMKGIIYVGFLSSFLAGLIAVTNLASNSVKTIGALTVAMVALGAMVGALTFAMKEGPEKIGVASAALSSLMLALGFMGQMVNRVKKLDYKAFGSLIAVMGILAAVLSAMLAFVPNLDMAIKVAGAIGILSLSLIPAMMSLWVAGKIGNGMSAALTGLAVAVVAIGVILALIGALRKWIPDDLPEKCEIVGSAIGKLFGSINEAIITAVGSGIGGGMAKAYQVMGEAIKNFSDMARQIDTQATLNAMNCMLEMAKVMLILSGTKFFEKTLGAPDFDKFKVQLSKLGAGITAFGVTIQNANVSAIKASVPAVSALVEVSRMLPRSGGLFQMFAGVKDLGKFGTQLATFGGCLVLFSASLYGVNTEQILNSIPAIQAIVNIAGIIPDWGILGIFFGQQDLSVFGTQLAIFGGCLVAYSLSLYGIRNEAILNSIPAVEALVRVAKAIPDWSIFGVFFTGNQSFSVFGRQLKSFGKSLVDYGDSVEKVSVNKILRSVDAARGLVSVAKELPDDGLIQWVQGKQGLDDFGDKLEDFGKGLGKFYASIAKADIKSNTTSVLIANLNRLVDFIPSLDDVNLDDLTDFGDALADFGDSLWDFGTDTTVIGKDNPIDKICTSTLSAIEKLRGYVDDFNQAGKDCLNGFLAGISDTKSLENVANSGEIVGTTFLERFRYVTGWHSPWSTMVDAGQDAASGLLEGTTRGDGLAVAREAGEALAANMLAGHDDLIGRHSNPDEYIQAGVDCANGLNEGATSDKAAKAAKEGGESLGASMFAGFGEKLSSGMKTATNWITKTAGETKTKFDSLVSGESTILDFLGLGFDTSMDSFGSQISDTVDSIAESTQSSLSGVMSSAGSYSGAKAADAFLEAFENRISDLDMDLSTIDLEKELWEATIGQKASEADKNAKETEIVRQKIEIQNEKVDQANQKYDYLVKKMGKTSEEAKKAYQELLQAQIDLANLMNEVNTTQDTVSNTSTDAMVAYAQYIAESKEDLLKLGFTMEQISAAAAERTGYNLQNTTQNMTESVTGAVQTAMNTVSSTYATTAESTIGALTTNFESYGVKYAESLGNGMITTTSAVTTGAKALSNAGEAAINSDYKQWYSLGQMCAEGFKQGILSKASEIADAARAVAAAAFSAAQVEIDSHSPSRKFMWLGEMGGKGFAIGFENMTSQVAKSSEEMSRGAIDAARETIKQIADVIDTDPTLHPQIAPVIDLSSVRGGLSRIGSMKTPVINTQVTGARVAAVASSLGRRQVNDNQPQPQNNQNGPPTIEFVQNNYSPKALSRSEIYRNTNNQFTAFKEAISRV